MMDCFLDIIGVRIDMVTLFLMLASEIIIIELESDEAFEKILSSL